MKINFFAENISFLLQKADLTPNALSEKLGVDSATVYRWLDPKIQSIPRSRTRVLVSQFFGVDAEKLINEKFTSDTPINIGSSVGGKPIKRVSGEPIPLMKNDWQLGVLSFFDDDAAVSHEDFPACAQKWLPAAPDKTLNQDQLIAINATGNAMAPEIRDGDLVYVEFDFFFEGKERPIYRDGDFVLAEPKKEKNGEEIDKTPPIIRKLIYGDNEHDMWLKATNPDFPGAKFVKAHTVLGKVVAIFRKL